MTAPDLEDTIVALSSAAGPGARAIVRLSGRLAPRIATELCPEFDRETQPRGQLFSGRINHPDVAHGLPVEIFYFLAPRTYTGQDVIEFHTISSPPLVEALVAACLNAGARSAQPGEFTMRAFLAGKLDLTRAEAVLGAIEANDERELGHALAQLAGGLEKPLHALREDLLNLLADIEAGLDFTDEDIHFVTQNDLLRRLGNGLAHLTILKQQLDRRSIGHRPFRVVLAGRPNAGKSSLFNALVGADSALVSPEAGTTRDYLEKTIDLAGSKVTLIDTAGIQETTCPIEGAARELGQTQAQKADLVLWCTSCDAMEADASPPAKALRVATKADLGPAPPNAISTSASRGTGISTLRAQIADAVRQARHTPLAPSLSRCRHHVDACLQYLRQAHSLALEEGVPELLALQVRLALEELGAMIGAIYTEDLLDRIFSRFCIGK